MDLDHDGVIDFDEWSKGMNCWTKEKIKVRSAVSGVWEGGAEGVGCGRAGQWLVGWRVQGSGE